MYHLFYSESTQNVIIHEQDKIKFQYMFIKIKGIMWGQMKHGPNNLINENERITISKLIQRNSWIKCELQGL